MIKEFKSFISRGNVIDLAVGVIIGGAFGKIVTSLVNDILMPVIGVFLGGIDFTSLAFKIGEASIAYGAFLQNILDFLIVSACIFLMVKVINKLAALGKKKEEEETAASTPVKSEEVQLLEEIRDLLSKNSLVQPKKKK